MRPSKGNISEKIQLAWHQIFQGISAPTTLAKVVDRYSFKILHFSNYASRKHYTVLYCTQHRCDRRVSLLLCGYRKTLSYVRDHDTEKLPESALAKSPLWWACLWCHFAAAGGRAAVLLSVLPCLSKGFWAAGAKSKEKKWQSVCGQGYEAG